MKSSDLSCSVENSFVCLCAFPLAFWAPKRIVVNPYGDWDVAKLIDRGIKVAISLAFKADRLTARPVPPAKGALICSRRRRSRGWIKRDDIQMTFHY